MNFRSISAILAVALFLFLPAIPVQAQIPGTGGGSAASTSDSIDPATMSPEAIDAMVARMSDDEVRKLLLDRLDAVAEAAASQDAPPEGIVATTKRYWIAFSGSLVDAIAKSSMVFEAQSRAVSNFANKYPGSSLLQLFGLIALVLAIGYAAERATGFLTRRWKLPKEVQDEADLRTTISFLTRRFGRELLGLAVFYIVIVSIGRATLNQNQLAFAGPFVFYMIWIPRLGAAISRFILAPTRKDLRMVNVDDHWAQYLHRNLIGLFILIGFTIFIVNFNVSNGVQMGETRLGFWLNSAVHIYIAWMAWTARAGLVDMMRGSDPDRSEFDEWVARGYPYFAIAVSAIMWVVVETIAGLGNPKMLKLLGTAPHYTTMFWLLMAPAIDTFIRGLVRHLLPPMIGEGPLAERAYKSTKRSYIRIGRVVAVAFVVLMIAGAWDIDLRNLAAAGVGDNFASNIIEFVLITAVGYVAYEVVSLWINRQLAKEQTSTAQSDEEMGGGEGGGAGGSRLATVLPLMRISAQAAIVVIFALLALGSLGIDTTPLLAGAGILGLAIGFGAQKLVTDIVSGVFFLIDDAFRVGEYVDVGGTMGTVEKISIRSMQLRHHRGLVHTIPYGEIPKLTNFSRDWVIMKLMFTVPFDTDPNKVKKIFKKIGAEMMEDPLYKDDFLEPFKSQGVFQFDDVGIVMRGKFMAKPGTQFTIRKEIYNRVRAEFAANGIEFARREVRVALPESEHEAHLSQSDKEALAAAAGSAVQTEMEKQQAEQAAKK